MHLKSKTPTKYNERKKEKATACVQRQSAKEKRKPY